MSIFSLTQKIDDRIKKFNKQIERDKRRISKSKDLNLIKMLELDIEKTNVAINQLNWVIENL
jgi:predicted  nucleic acid-binding Zn-ribbon protein